MYKVNKDNGDIHFPDGFVLSVPYQDDRYLEYAAWVHAGNEPELITDAEAEALGGRS